MSVTDPNVKKRTIIMKDLDSGAIRTDPPLEAFTLVGDPFYGGNLQVDAFCEGVEGTDFIDVQVWFYNGLMDSGHGLYCETELLHIPCFTAYDDDHRSKRKGVSFTTPANGNSVGFTIVACPSGAILRELSVMLSTRQLSGGIV